MIYLILKHAHSGVRWILLLLLVFTLIRGFLKLISRSKFTKGFKTLAAMTMSFAHIQLLIGIFLFFTSDKVVFSSTSFRHSTLRFYLLEHPTMMIISILLITIGYIQSKKAKTDQLKFARILIYYMIALVLILVAVPWPWRVNLGGGWY